MGFLGDLAKKIRRAAAKRGYVDDVISPDSTRPRIIAALEMLSGKREGRPSKKHGNIPL